MDIQLKTLINQNEKLKKEIRKYELMKKDYEELKIKYDGKCKFINEIIESKNKLEKELEDLNVNYNVKEINYKSELIEKDKLINNLNFEIEQLKKSLIKLNVKNKQFD